MFNTKNLLLNIKVITRHVEIHNIVPGYLGLHEFLRLNEQSNYFFKRKSRYRKILYTLTMPKTSKYKQIIGGYINVENFTLININKRKLTLSITSEYQGICKVKNLLIIECCYSNWNRQRS